MKRIHSIATACLMGLMLFCSCDKWLSIPPEDGVIKDNYWSTKEEVYAAVIGLYSGMLNENFTTRFYLWGELRGETLQTNESMVNAAYQAIRDGEITSTNILTDWSWFYRIINFCNTVVEYAPAAQKSDPSFTDAMLRQYQAEAIAIRSLLYFHLVRTFRDVPYYTQAYVSDDQKMMIAKSAGDSILRELTVTLEAEAVHLAASYGQKSDVNHGRMTRQAVYALLADIYLWLEDYDACIRNCDKVMSSGHYALLMSDESNFFDIEMENPVTNTTDTIKGVYEQSANEFFESLYVRGNSNESIFEIQREKDLSNKAYYNLFNNTTGYFKAAVDVLKDIYFLPSEVNPKEWFDVRAQDFSYKGEYVWKHLGRNRYGKLLDAARPTQDDWDGNIIVYRLAEIYLMKAESLIMKASVSTEPTELLKEALSLIYEIRRRSNATETTDLCSGLSDDELTVNTLLQFVYEERIREMMFEGKRWFDALRFAKRNQYEDNNLNYLTQMAVYGASVTKVGTLQNKLKNANFHYLPIYKKELEANKLLVQNPFYND